MVLSGVINRIDQRRIPGLSRLYADYLYDFPRVARFYPAGAAFDFDRLALMAGRLSYPAAHRRAIADLLQRQNQAWAPAGRLAPATAERIEQFASPHGVVVVTGQQVGVAGGPLLAFHKAMAAVLVAERLRSKGIPAVPVFWMASQDHDLAEVDHAWVLDAASQPQRLKVTVDGVSAAGAGPVGELRLQSGETVAARMAALVEAENLDRGALGDLEACYRPGATLTDAFAGLFSRWFAPWGLLLFDPLQAPEAAGLWQPYYEKVLRCQPELSAALQRRNAELTAAGYHVQVEQTAAATMLFFHRDGARQGLRRLSGERRDVGHELWLGEHPMGCREAQQWIADHPDQVSPAALLRPLLQNVVFPTVAQVTGPAETAYLAQTSVLYPVLGASEPVAYPRATATLVDPKAQRLLQKYQIELEQIWHEPVEELLARRALPAGIERQVEGIRAHFDQKFLQLGADLGKMDSSLVDAAQGAVQKIRHQLEQLEVRVARSFARRSEEIGQHARHLAGSLFPEHSLQERELSTVGWMLRYPKLGQWLHERLDAATPDHQVIEL